MACSLLLALSGCTSTVEHVNEKGERTKAKIGVGHKCKVACLEFEPSPCMERLGLAVINKASDAVLNKVIDKTAETAKVEAEAEKP